MRFFSLDPMICSTRLTGRGTLSDGVHESFNSCRCVVNHSGECETQNQQTPPRAGLHTGRGRGNSMTWTVASFPELRFLVKRKPRFR